MISSERDSCSQLVAGNCDVIIGGGSTSTMNGDIRPFSRSLKSIITNYLDRFEHHESQLVNPKDCDYANEFKLLKEFSNVLKEDKANLLHGEMDYNAKKNRYKDIIPFSHTRVVLSDNYEELPGSDYINANYIRGPTGSQRAYIACQGPLPCTLNDFWRMIWECGVSVIVMACNEIESGKPKCQLYWPEDLNTSSRYGKIQVTLSRVKQINSDFLIRKFSIKYLGNKQSGSPTDQNHHQPTEQPYSKDFFNQFDRKLNENDIDCNSMGTLEQQVNGSNEKFTSYNTSNNVNLNNNYPTANNLNNLSRSNFQKATANNTNYLINDSERNQKPPNHLQEINGDILDENECEVLMERTVCQFHYTTWPDHGVPNSVSPILELVRLMREVQPEEDKPILVHCSAGCGRTGTICCIDYVWNLLRRGKLDQNFNLCSIISEMRQQRMAMVQTLEQYILCHRAVAALFIQQLKLIDDHHYENVEQSSLSDDCQGDDQVVDDVFEEPDELGPVFI